MKLTYDQLLKEYFKGDETITTPAKELQELFISIDEEMRLKDAKIRELKQEKIILTNLCKDLKREMKSIKADSLLKQDYFLDLSA